MNSLQSFAFVLALALLNNSEGSTFADVAPIFAEHCTICHSGEDPAAALSLESLDALKKGGESGPAAIAGNAERSEIVIRLRGQKRPKMPLDADPLAEEEIARIEAFINGGLLAAPADATIPEMTPKPRPVPKPGEPVAFADVQPILSKNCVKCHIPFGERGAPPEGFRLDTWQEATSTRERARIVPGAPGASELVRRIKGVSQPRMPFGSDPLSADEIRLLEDWVLQGAPGPDGKKLPIPTGAQVRFRGILTKRYAIDGLAFEVGSNTRIDKDPAPGDTVELRGVVLPDGRIQATRLRRR